MADGEPGFHAARTGKPGEAVLGRGKLDVGIEGDTLVLRGANGGRLALPFRSIARLRLSRLRDAGRNPSRRRFYRLAIWQDAGGPPMILWPEWTEAEAFHGVMRKLAAEVWAGGRGRVEKGVSWAAAARSSLWLFIALAVVLYLADHELRWNLSLLGQIAALLGLALISSVTTRFDRDAPRAIDGAAELEWLFKV